MKTAKFVTITILLFFITTFSVTGTVMSQSRGRNMVDAKHYRALENDYIASVRQQLAGQGYKNAGVTMTKIIENDGRREYTVMLHHKRINALSEGEQRQLAENLGNTWFPVEDCVFVYKFLE